MNADQIISDYENGSLQKELEGLQKPNRLADVMPGLEDSRRNLETAYRILQACNEVTDPSPFSIRELINRVTILTDDADQLFDEAHNLADNLGIEDKVYHEAYSGREMTAVSRNLTQDEIDGYFRYDFVKTILNHIQGGSIAKFIVKGQKHYKLVQVQQKCQGEWEFSATGTGSWYSYKFSDLVSFLEQIWSKATEIISLDGEIQVEFQKPTANKADTESQPES